MFCYFPQSFPNRLGVGSRLIYPGPYFAVGYLRMTVLMYFGMQPSCRLYCAVLFQLKLFEQQVEDLRPDDPSKSSGLGGSRKLERSVKVTGSVQKMVSTA